MPAFLLLLAGAAAQPAGAAPRESAPKTALKRSAAVDTGAVRRYYLDGEFEPAIALLEKTLRTGSGFDHEDSVFIFKHLGVMYAARFETREKGKHYMHRLLEVEPTARILDMYASDMIYMIFKNIRDEFEASRQRMLRADSLLAGGGRAAPGKRPEPPRESRRKGNAVYIWVGAAAIAATAATWYYLANEEPDTHVVVDQHDP